MGSGTTAMAALKDNRRYIGFEINQDYIKLTNKRVLPYNKA
jgi:DNA modification methylase